jgi:hypothetical protein
MQLAEVGSHCVHYAQSLHDPVEGLSQYVY